jgi:hypothetical protein
LELLRQFDQQLLVLVFEKLHNFSECFHIIFRWGIMVDCISIFKSVPKVFKKK